MKEAFPILSDLSFKSPITFKFVPFLIINPNGKINMDFLFSSDDFIYTKTYQDLKEKINKFKENSKFHEEYWITQLNLLKKHKFFS